MKNRKSEFNEINPYVRICQHISGTSDDFYVPWRVIYDFEVIFIIAGSMEIHSDEEIILMKAGECIIIPPFLRHKQLIPEGGKCEYYGIHLDFFYDENEPDFLADIVYSKPCLDKVTEAPISQALANRSSRAIGDVSFFKKITVQNAVEIAGVFADMYKAYGNNDELTRLDVKIGALRLISILIRNIIGKADILRREEIISSFVNYARNHFSEDIDISDLAYKYGFSPNYFRKLIKLRVRNTPNEYIIGLRLETAKKLLAGGNYAISEICEMVGYEDPHYFSRVFKQKEGVSPANYAKRIQAEKEKS